jgi:AcrR family transcriptional regulator
MEPVPPDTRTRILVAAARVVRDKGVQRLTLEEVARVASVSKGGLLYHFSTKEQLIQAMLEYALIAFEDELNKVHAGDAEPGSWLRAYIKASFPDQKSSLYEQSMLASALLASVGNEPSLAGPYGTHLKSWARRAVEDGIDPAVAQIIRLAVDALWLHEALGLQPFDRAERARLIKDMVALTKSAVSLGASKRRGRR